MLTMLFDCYGRNNVQKDEAVIILMDTYTRDTVRIREVLVCKVELMTQVF